MRLNDRSVNTYREMRKETSSPRSISHATCTSRILFVRVAACIAWTCTVTIEAADNRFYEQSGSAYVEREEEGWPRGPQQSRGVRTERRHRSSPRKMSLHSENERDPDVGGRASPLLINYQLNTVARTRSNEDSSIPRPIIDLSLIRRLVASKIASVRLRSNRTGRKRDRGSIGKKVQCFADKIVFSSEQFLRQERCRRRDSRGTASLRVFRGRLSGNTKDNDAT